MTARIFVLPTQYDIIDFRLGNRPANILARDFGSAAEVLAYEEGIGSVGDETDRIENLQVTGTRVSYTRRPDDPENPGAKSETVEVEFGTAAEAQAYRRGIEDTEGCAAPLLIDDTDDRFEQLQEWCAAAKEGPAL